MVMITWKEKAFYISAKLKENLDNYVKGVLTKNTSAVFLVDGRSGLGKTTLTSQVGCYISKKVGEHLKREAVFTLDSMCWNPDDLIEKLKKAKKGDIIILDESMILSNRSTMSEVNKAVIIMMSLIRSKQIFVMFCVNSIFDLDKNLPLHRADMLIHLYAEDDKFGSRGRYFVVPSVRGRLKSLYILGKKYYNYGVAKPTLRDKFSKFFPFDQDEYEQRKQEAISRYFEKKKPIVLAKVRQSLALSIGWHLEEHSPEEVSNRIGYSRSQVYKLKNLIKQPLLMDEYI